MLYRDVDGNVTEVDTAGATDNQVLTRVSGVPAWADPSLASRVTLRADPNDAIFQAIGAVALPDAELRDGFPIVAFAQDVNQGIPFEFVMPQDYDDGAISVNVYWTAGGTAGTVEWEGSVERNEEGHIITATAFDAVQTASEAIAGTDGIIVKTTIAFADNTDFDGVVGGDPFRFFLQRDITVGGNLLADAQLLYLAIIEDAV
jgi:hypothetical protein